jgi:hypothetical protein
MADFVRDLQDIATVREIHGVEIAERVVRTHYFYGKYASFFAHCKLLDILGATSPVPFCRLLQQNCILIE